MKWYCFIYKYFFFLVNLISSSINDRAEWGPVSALSVWQYVCLSISLDVMQFSQTRFQIFMKFGMKVIYTVIRICRSKDVFVSSIFQKVAVYFKIVTATDLCFTCMRKTISPILFYLSTEIPCPIKINIVVVVFGSKQHDYRLSKMWHIMQTQYDIS